MGITTEIKQIFDFNLFGGLSSEGLVNTLQGKDAFINSFSMWLLNKEGDFIRQPEKGGYLYNWLCKPMSNMNAKAITLSLKTGIEKEYTPRIIIEQLEVIPNYEKRLWTILVKGYVPSVDTYIDFKQNFRNLV
jgi:hypothetical protein